MKQWFPPSSSHQNHRRSFANRWTPGLTPDLLDQTIQGGALPPGLSLIPQALLLTARFEGHCDESFPFLYITLFGGGGANTWHTGHHSLLVCPGQTSLVDRSDFEAELPFSLKIHLKKVLPRPIATRVPQLKTEMPFSRDYSRCLGSECWTRNLNSK